MQKCCEGKIMILGRYTLETPNIVGNIIYII